MNSYRVVPCIPIGKRHPWAVRIYGRSRAYRVFSDPYDAIALGRKLAKRDFKKLYIHDYDGTVESVENYEQH